MPSLTGNSPPPNTAHCSMGSGTRQHSFQSRLCHSGKLLNFSVSFSNLKNWDNHSTCIYAVALLRRFSVSVGGEGAPWLRFCMSGSALLFPQRCSSEPRVTHKGWRWPPPRQPCTPLADRVDVQKPRVPPPLRWEQSEDAPHVCATPGGDACW